MKKILEFAGRKKMSILLVVCILITVIIPTNLFSANEMQVAAQTKAVSANEPGREQQETPKAQGQSEKLEIIETDVQPATEVLAPENAVTPEQEPVQKAQKKQSVSNDELEAEAVSGGALVKDVTLYKGSGLSDPTLAELPSPSELKDHDSLVVKVDFVDVLDFTDTAITKDSQYELMKIPQEIAIGTEIEWNVNYNAGTQLDPVEKPLGKAKITTDGTLYFTFDEALDSRVGQAYISFTAAFDASSYGTEYAKDVTFVYGSSHKTIVLQNEANRPTDPVLSKAGSYLPAVNEIEWTLTVQKAKNMADYPNLKLVDVLPADNAEYVAGSMKRNSSPYAGVTVSGNDLIISDFPATEDSTFTFRTKCDPLQWVNTSNQLVSSTPSVNVRNEAQLYRMDNTPIGSRVDATVSVGGTNTWTSKSTGQAVAGQPGMTKWTVTVDTHGNTFQNMVVLDQINGFNPNYNTAEETLKPTIEFLQSGAYKPTITGAEGSTAASISMTAGKPVKIALQTADSNKAKGVYIITYYTQITNYEEYCKYNQSSINNQAWMTFDWPQYNGGPDTLSGITGPSVYNTATMTAGSISKSSTGYNSSTHELTWEIVINAVGANMSAVKVVDYIASQTNQEAVADATGKLTQEYVGVKEIKIGNTVIGTDCLKMTDANAQGKASVTRGSVSVSAEGISAGTKKVTFDLGDTLKDGDKAVITLVTRLTDKDYYESNHYQTSNYNTERKTFYNCAQAYVDDMPRSYAPANCTPQIKVLEKEAEAYDYAEHLQSWKITVNRDKMALAAPTVKDTLAEGLSLVEGSLMLNGTAISKGGAIKPYYTETDGVLAIYLKDFAQGAEPAVITYDTLVDVEGGTFDGKTFTQTNEDITLKNTAELSKTGSSAITDVPAAKVVHNNILVKECVPDRNKMTADYSVKINQAMNDLVDMKIVDVMSAGLKLKPASITLYRATVDSSTGNLSYTEDDKVEASEFTIDTSIISEGADKGKTELVVSLPDGKCAYVLTYQAQVCQVGDAFVAGGYSNDAALTNAGTQNIQTEKKVMYNEIVANGGGGILFANSYYIKVMKNAAEDNDHYLAGAEFVLRQTVNGKKYEIDRGVTDENGELYFAALDKSTEYEVEEVAAPSGYVLAESEADRIQVVSTKETAGRANAAAVTFTNEKIPLSFRKVDEKGSALAGAQFSLYSISEEETEGCVSANGMYETLVETASSDQTGNVSFLLATDGVYRIKEIKAPEGYDKTDKVYIAVVEDNLLSLLYEEGDEDMVRVGEIVNTLTPTETPDPDPEPETPPANPQTPPVTGTDTVTPPADTPVVTDPQTPEEDDPEDDDEDDEDDDDKKDTDKTDTITGGGSSQTPTASQSALPKTGREARAVFFVLGLALIGCGVALFRRKREKKEMNR